MLRSHRQCDTSFDLFRMNKIKRRITYDQTSESKINRFHIRILYTQTHKNVHAYNPKFTFQFSFYALCTQHIENDRLYVFQ